MSTIMNRGELSPHPRNGEFFDDIEGDAWQAFLESVEKSGIIEPLVITQEKVVVSGHQRLRAAGVLGIEQVPVEVRIFDSEDDVLKALIETNIRQRGVGNPNPVKFGKCLAELERIGGIRHGGPRSPEGPSMTQAEMARALGLSPDTVARYKALAAAVPEVQDLVSGGRISPAAARSIVARLSEDEQRELAAQIGEGDTRYTRAQVEALLKERQDALDALEALEAQRNDLMETKYRIETDLQETRSNLVASQLNADAAKNTIQELQEKIDELNMALDEKPTEVEVAPPDYEEALGLRDEYVTRIQNMREELTEKQQACIRLELENARLADTRQEALATATRVEASGRLFATAAAACKEAADRALAFGTMEDWEREGLLDTVTDLLARLDAIKGDLERSLHE